jgi:hypothetical protein
MDLIYIGLIIALFALTWVLIKLCSGLGGAP